ncbi:Hypp2548 [Branchiostoma lanceolatum]|uniref:Hypp2548 protein n=1 Tax=Branchiostoma lanceolatum TaxID=7740 RepID=A0A8J9ZUS3_BRALA|nr:Hypp2548 [Branchiostoma lanceolatum]
MCVKRPNILFFVLGLLSVCGSVRGTVTPLSTSDCWPGAGVTTSPLSGNSVPDVVFSSFPGIETVLRTQAQVLSLQETRDDGANVSRYCFKPDVPVTMAETTAGLSTYQTASMLPYPLPGYSPPPATEHVPLIMMDVENGQLVGADVFTGQTMSEYTSLPVTDVRFTYHVTPTSTSFSALGTYVIGNATFNVRALRTRDGKFSVTGTSPSPLPFRDIERQFYIPAPQDVYGETVGRVGLEDTVFQAPTLSVCTDDWGVQAGLQISGTVSLPTLAGLPSYSDVVVRLTDGRYHLSTGVIVDNQSLQGLVHTVTGQDIPFLSAITTPGFGVGLSFADNETSLVGTPCLGYRQEPLASELGHTVPRDLHMVLRAQLPTDCGGEPFCQVSKMLLGDNAALLLRGKMSAASIAVSGGLQDVSAGPLTFSSVELFMEFSRGLTATYGLGFQVEMQFPVQGAVAHGTGSTQYLNVGGKLRWLVGTPTIGGTLYMRGVWERAFGIDFLSFGNINMGLQFTVGVPYPSGGQFGGLLQLGSNCFSRADYSANGNCFGGQVYVGLSSHPDDNYFYGRIEAVTLQKLLRVFGSDFQMPASIGNSGFPTGLETSGAVREVDLTSAGGPLIPVGLTFTGKINVFGLALDSVLRMSATSLLGAVQLDPLNLGNLVVLTKARGDSTAGPIMHMETRLLPSFVLDVHIQGSCRLFGVDHELNLKLSDTQVEARLHQTLFGLFDTELYLSAPFGGDVTSLPFRARVTFKTGIAQLVDQISRWLDTAFNDARGALRRARDDVAAAKLECQRVLDIQCDNCMTLRCQEAANDCNGFFDDVGNFIVDAANTVGDWFVGAGNTIADGAVAAWNEVEDFFSSWGRRRRRTALQSAQRSDQTRFNPLCDGLVDYGCQAVSHLCQGSCIAVEFVAQGTCNTLDVATGALYLAEATSGWVELAVNWLMDIFQLHEVHFDTTLDVNSLDNTYIRTYLDLTVFGQRASLDLEVNFSDIPGSVVRIAQAALNFFKDLFNLRRVHHGPGYYLSQEYATKDKIFERTYEDMMAKRRQQQN